MRTLIWLTTTAMCIALAIACAKKDDNANAASPTASAGYPPPGYGTAGAYGQPPPGQPAYGQPAYGQQPPPPGYPGAAPTAATPAATAAGAGATGTMAVPGPLAFPCQNDSACGTHHCNTQYGKCAFPCQSATDCISGNQCMVGLCTPGAPGH